MRRRIAGSTRRRWLTVTGAALAAAGPTVLAAQGNLVSARAHVDLTGHGPPSLRIEYVVTWEGPPEDVPLEGLAFGGARASGVRALAGGRELDVSLRESRRGRISGEVAPPLDVEPGRPFRFTLHYRVEGAEEHDGSRTLIRLPVLAVAWPSEQALAETFTVDLVVADSLTVYESFPSGMRAIEGPPRARRYALDLPVVPALVSVRASSTAMPLATLPLALDALVLALLAGFGMLGWRRLGDAS